MNLSKTFAFALTGLVASACSSSTPAGGASAPVTPASVPASAPSAAEVVEAVDNTIVGVAVGAGDFTTLVTAVKAAGLVETLQSEGPFTVFAPTDAAFAKLPAGTVEGLLADKAKLTAVLTYHVVPGKVMAADVGGLTEAGTVNGAKVAIDTSDGVKVGGATVVKTDIEASNGVIHVIDTVMLPPE